MKLAINKKDFILLFILISMIFPTIRFLGFEMPFEYLYSAFGFLVVLYVLFGQARIPSFSKSLFVISFLILIQIFFSTYLSTTSRFGYFTFPTDIIQYIVRFIFFFTFMIFAYGGQIKSEKFIKYFLYVLIGAMTIGILQWIPWPGRVLMIKLYPFRDGNLQLSQLNRSLVTLRLHGFAQHATANGGLATFCFVYAYSVFRYFSKHKKSSLVLMGLALINVIASQARAGMLALICSMFFFYVVAIKYNSKRLRSMFLLSRKRLNITLQLIGLIGALLVTLKLLYDTSNKFVVFMYNRWIGLFETGGGARLNIQTKYFFNMMNGMDYIMGLSKPIINLSDITHGVEIEPINIFVTFGAIGFLLQYALVAILLLYFYKRISKINNDSASLCLIVSSFVGLLSYQVFSVAFYFFREIRVGLFPWVLMGVAMGYYERFRKCQTASKQPANLRVT
jgi:hypothetical protein